MKSIQVDYEPKSKAVTMKKNVETEDWLKVCHKFNDDVERVMDIENRYHWNCGKKNAVDYASYLDCLA